MNELQFKITGMTIEKRINGDTIIDAICLQSNVPIKIKIQSSLSTKEYVKNELTKEYFKLLNNDLKVNVGDIL